MELSTVSQELHQVRLALNEARQTEDTVNEMAADVETLKQGLQHIRSEGGDFATNLKLVTNAVPSGAHFTSVEIATDQITVEGKADSPSAIVSYAMALEAQEKFSEVRIAEITETETTESESTGVSFTIIVNK